MVQESGLILSSMKVLMTIRSKISGICVYYYYYYYYYKSTDLSDTLQNVMPPFRVNRHVIVLQLLAMPTRLG